MKALTLSTFQTGNFFSFPLRQSSEVETIARRIYILAGFITSSALCPAAGVSLSLIFHHRVC
jgi:hypothetical protein